MPPIAIILLSGGMDSATTAAIAKSDGFTLHALSFDYGQRHRVELEAARRVGQALGVARHVTLPIDLRAFGGSALTDDIEVPKHRSVEELTGHIPSTYVPARNTVFLALALAYAEVSGAGDLYLGVNAVDYSGYPDCRPEYVVAFERLANLATKAAIEGRVTYQIHTPLIALDKAGIVRRGVELGVDFALTHSCYDPTEQGKSCGHCDACLLRQKGFQEAGLTDPLTYT